MEWNEVVQWVFQLSTLSTDYKICAYRVMTTLAMFWYDVPVVSNNFDQVLKGLSSGLTDSDIKVLVCVCTY